MTRPTVPCPKCAGCGVMPLLPPLWDVLQLIKTGEEMTATLMCRLIKVTTGDEIGITAMNNRLESLRKYGFVDRRKKGKQWLYRLTEEIK